nr:MAG TPA: hypothetical protein [Caudoviricetes sp.]
MIKIYLLVATFFLEILFIWLEINELQNWYKAIENQMFKDFNTRTIQRKYARKKAVKSIFKILLIGFLAIYGISFLK